MTRTVRAEILDQLPACNLDAIASRKDLRTINCLMGNFRWTQSRLRAESLDPPHRILELGAGDGALANRILSKWPKIEYTALDLAPEPENWPESAQWLRQDCLSFNEYGSYTHVIANLFLHHLQADALNDLGDRIQGSSVQTLIACEPCRRRWHQWQLKAGKWIGFNWVTLSDGCTSVEAGFRGDELPQLLGLSPQDWNWTIHETFMGAYRMWATRR